MSDADEPPNQKPAWWTKLSSSLPIAAAAPASETLTTAVCPAITGFPTLYDSPDDADWQS